MSHHPRPFAVLAAAAVLTAVAGIGVIATPAGALPPTDFSPTQADCDSGSVSTIWPNTGITTRPTITSVTIDGESISPSRISAPNDGEIGVAICAQDPNFAKNSGLSFYRKVSSMTQSSNLTGAVTPGGRTITSASRIVATVSMGDLSPYYSFATVFGTVNSWTTTGLQSAAATLTFDVSPVAGVMVDGLDDQGNQSSAEQGCTQQPPNCDPPKADADTFGVYMQFKAERGSQTAFNSFAGGYFALRSAVGGFVTAKDGGLEVTIAGPHYKADGSTLNVGSMSAFLPESFLQQAFGIGASTVTDTTFAVTRREGGASTAAPAAWTYRVVPGGIAVDVPTITFSSPTYRITKGSGSATPSTGYLPSQWPAPPFFHTVSRGTTVAAVFAAAPRAAYVVTYTNGFRTYHLGVISSADDWKAQMVARKLTKGSWMVVSRQFVPGGFSSASVTVVRV